MAAIPVAVSEIIPLHHHVDNGKTGLFVIAILKNAAGTPIAGSPFSLTDVGDGTYTNNAQSMPNAPFIIVTYKAYKDAGLTVRFRSGDGQDLLYIPEAISAISRRDKIFGVIYPRPQLSALVQNDNIQGIIERPALSGKVDSDGGINGFIGDLPNLKGVVEKCS